MKIEIDYSESDRFTTMILDKKLSSEGVFKGSFTDFLALMTELKIELEKR